MDATPDCPSQKTLRQFAFDRLDEATRGQVSEHLANCELCAQAMSQFMSSLVSPGERGTIPDIKPHPKPPDPPKNDLSETENATCGDVVSFDDIEFDFLLPSDKPEALGRLGNYDVLSVLGRGGMGVVLKAFDDSLHRIVAIKVLAPELASSTKARRRFVREARAAAAINHPNVITIHAVDEQSGMP